MRVENLYVFREDLRVFSGNLYQIATISRTEGIKLDGQFLESPRLLSFLKYRGSHRLTAPYVARAIFGTYGLGYVNPQVLTRGSITFPDPNSTGPYEDGCIDGVPPTSLPPELRAVFRGFATRVDVIGPHRGIGKVASGTTYSEDEKLEAVRKYQSILDALSAIKDTHFLAEEDYIAKIMAQDFGIGDRMLS